MKINELREWVGNHKKIMDILEDFKNCFFGNVPKALYINVGFTHPEIFSIYKGLPNIIQFQRENPNQDNLKEILEEQFKLMEKNDIYLYKIIVQKTGGYEIRDTEEVNKIFQNYSENPTFQTIKENLIKLFSNYKSFYLTIYYGGVFILDSLLIFKREFNDEGIILFIKAYLQYLAGYLMSQISTIHALRSAIAAIMSRNMSHNIGSHVLNYLSNPEELDNLWII